jgi:SAM-dependent methyltransferase
LDYVPPVPLPDASRLLDLPASTWRALGERLRAVEFNVGNVESILFVAPAPLAAWRLPIRIWHARKRGDLAATALRMLVLGDPVTRAKAQEVFGDIPVETLVSVGFLVERPDGGVVCPFVFGFANKDFVLSDELGHGGDAVMGPGSTTQVLVSGALPILKPTHRALDVGCGAGTLAVLLARGCEKVVATDVNARAVVLTKVNALLGGITNLDVRQGDLFEPVAGETFDLIGSQPPFVAQPSGIADAAYLFGGPRGDRIALRVLEGAGAHLAEGGRALVLGEWMSAPGDPSIEDRVRAVLPRDVDVMHLLRGKTALDDYCLNYVAIRHPQLGEEFVTEVNAWRDHLDAMGITEIRMALHVLQRPNGRRAFTSSLHIRDDAMLTPVHVNRWMAARDLVTRGPAAVLDAKVSLLPRLVSGQADEKGVVLVQPPKETCLDPVSLPHPIYKILPLIAAAPRVRDAAAAYASATSLPQADAEAHVFAAASQGLLLGLLELPGRSV